MRDKQVALNFEGEERFEEDLNDLFYEVKNFRKSSEYLDYLNFISRLKRYSIFNTTLVYLQKPDTIYFATKKYWFKEYGRKIKEEAKPLVLLRPGGPVMFAYDISDTVGNEIPESLIKPFRVDGEFDSQVSHNLISSLKSVKIRLDYTTEVIQKGGAVRRISQNDNQIRFLIGVNKRQSDEVNFQTIVHELSHIFCGHLGNTPDEKWPDRRNLSINSREFEAESVSYLVCKRKGLTSNSSEYLAGYVSSHQLIPLVSIQYIIKSVEWIEKMINGVSVDLYSEQEN